MCDLCILEDKTNTYMDTKKFIILDCDSCLVPMAVWKEHTMSIGKEYEELMESMLHKVAKKFYGNEYASHPHKVIDQSLGRESFRNKFLKEALSSATIRSKE